MPRSGPGALLGTPLVGAFDYFLAKYGRAAGHEVVARLPVASREQLNPHAPALGVIGSRWYPYPLVGELVRTMGDVVKAPREDDFIREMSVAGIDSAVSTAMRFVLRFAVSPLALAARGQEAWNMFHDSGRVTILAVTDNEYVAQLSDWPNHDTTVCKIVTEVRRRLIERTGVHAVAVREKCVSWGHGTCVTRVRWTPR
jgi:hypothetical protein